MSFENPKLEQPTEKEPEIEERGEKEKMEYNPVVSLRRDFSSEWIYRDEETDKAVIDDPDSKQIMGFYRKEVKEGTLLDLGPGSTHLHYMAALEDKLTHITALDLSEKNLKVLQELMDGVGQEAEAKKAERKHISDEDLEILKISAEAQERSRNRKNPRTGQEVLQSIREKSTKEGSGEDYDFIVGDMHDLGKLEQLGQRKFDNIMLGFALFANKQEEIPKLFQQIREHLNPGGKVIIADFQGFSAEDMKDEFSEDRLVIERYPNPIDYSLSFLATSLEKAGFSKDAIRTRMANPRGEGEKDFKYLFVSASQEGPKTKAEMKKKWEEHFGGLAEAQLEQEKMARVAKKEKAVLEAAKIPEKGIQTEQILKEAGVEKSAESFGEFQKKLDENLGKARTYRGGMISETDKLMIARNAYLAELGYSVKYKGLLLDKAEIRDENNKPLFDKNGKPIEFKSFYFSKTERQINEFLKDKVKEKFEGKPEKAMTEEEKTEAGFKKTIKTTEQEQERREEKISFLTKIKKLSKSSFENLLRGMSYLAGSEELGMFGLRSGKKLAVEAGKDLAVLGLSPIAATEEAGRYIAGRIQTGEALKKSMIMQEKIKALKDVPANKRPEYYNDLMASLKVGAKIANAELIKGYDKIYIKGKILTKLIEALGGGLSRPVEKTLAPPPPKPERI